MKESSEEDHVLSRRKSDHIELAFSAMVEGRQLDPRFHYEPLLAAHPTSDEYPVAFLGKALRLPLWVSSMTGGTEKAGHINRNLARACSEFGMGMGLGSCRSLLDPQADITDFDMRGILGESLPFFGNLGIAQLEKLVKEENIDLVRSMVARLRLDGMIIHVNPLQEAFQPEGDRFEFPPLRTIRSFLDQVDFPVIIKEVGQGMGPRSLSSLLQLPIAALDFGAGGGTNFTKLEMLRASDQEDLSQFALVGHTAEEMVNMVNDLIMNLGDRVQCKEVIVSGGIKDFLEGYYLINKLNLSSVYGMASGFLQHALEDYDKLHRFVAQQARGLSLAKAYLQVRS
ncbi:MAG: isopentenyl-diphosphate delta-isomerase [Saprospiraceae bacterium]|nr:isopentenyl-diphosphate delta-isomerase [Saprospiraceae bacterium]